MLLTIHDAHLHPVASIDNDKQTTLNYFNETWTRFFETGAATFDLTVAKKALSTDTHSKRAYNLLSEKNFISFEYEGETQLFTVRKTVENEKVIKVNCVNLNLELINEYANPYKAPKAMSFKEYCEAMDLLNFTMLQIGVNEVSDKKITSEWEGQDTKLARLLSLANKFGAEIEFKTRLNDDSSIKAFVVNVYHENDAIHQGVGKVQNKVLRYGRDFRSLTRTVDTTGIYNATRPTGKTEEGEVVTIAGMQALEIKNEKGEIEFFQRGDMLYAPLSMSMFPAAFTSGTMSDQWIRKDFPVESASKEVIRSSALRELKKNCYPAVTYEVDGFLPYGPGDTVEVEDDGFYPALLLQMRVFEQSMSFTGTGENKTVFANFKAIENKVSSSLQQRLENMLEEAKPYLINLATDNGHIFKNNQGESTVFPTLKKGNKPVECTWKWLIDNEDFGQAPSHKVTAAGMRESLALTAIALVNGQEVAREQLTFTNVNDGEAGKSIRMFTTDYRYNQKAINQYSTDGYTGDWLVKESRDGLKQGDSVQIRVFNTDKNSDSWIIATVVAVNTNTIKTLSKGLIEKGDKGEDGKFNGVIGRRNLLKGTRALTRYATASEFNGFKVARSVAGTTGYRDTYSEQMTIAATGTEYIGLFWARASQNNYPIYCYFYNPGTTTTVTTSTGYTRERTGDGFCELRIGTEWKLYWVKWSQTLANAPKNIIFGRHGTWRGGTVGAWVEICAPALFEGHAVGDHVDAPEDTNDQIKQVEEQIPTNAAGRNYILNSDISGFLISNRTIDLSVSSDFFSDVNRERSFTMSLEVEGKNIQPFNGRKRYGLAFRFAFTDDTDWYPEIWQEVDTDKKRITRVWTLPAGKNLKSVYYAKILNQTNSTVSYGKPKLELGKLMTAWLPAIEDAPKRFEQASAPTNPSKDSVWKYTGTIPTNFGGVTVLPNTTYRYDGSNWQKETVNSTNLTIQDQFVKKSMIADKAVGIDQLDVKQLSAISADLGEVRAGNVLLQKQFPAGMSRDYWGTYQYNPYTMGVYISQNMIASNGFPVRKKSTDQIGTDMPVAAFTSGGIYFIKTDRTDDLKTLAENAISSVNSGSIAFGYTPEGKNALITRVNGELYFHSDNYTDWAVSQDNPNVKWKVQGNLVIVYYDITFDNDGTYQIATIPTKYVPGQLMLDMKAWQIFKDHDRNAQLNGDGGLHILQAKAGIQYRGQVTWSY